MTTEVAPVRNGDRGPVTGLPVQFDNALNVHFPRARPCVRIRNPPPAAPVARWPMTDAHGVKVNVSPTGDTLLRGKCNSTSDLVIRFVQRSGPISPDIPGTSCRFGNSRGWQTFLVIYSAFELSGLQRTAFAFYFSPSNTKAIMKTTLTLTQNYFVFYGNKKNILQPQEMKRIHYAFQIFLHVRDYVIFEEYIFRLWKSDCF